MEPIAIVGMGCRFPGGVDSPAAFWDLLLRGVDAIANVPPDRWNVERFYDPSAETPAKTSVRQGGFIRQRLEDFDAQFFGISPREAAFIDPQQRLLLEVAWEAFEDAGISVEALSGTRTGIFIGVMAQDWFGMQMVPGNRHLFGPHSATGSSSTLLSNRISYVFNLTGPSISIDTACSSSLVAVHYACRSIWDGECSQALAGGVNLMFGPNYPILMTKGHFLSPDARCKTFDERANGYVRGEGAGIVLLQPLSVALREGRDIHALIRGTAINQDGHTTGITVPSQAAQEALLREACRRACTAPNELQYVEAHGTGTAIGDVIEANALGAVLGHGRPANAPCLIGSVKTNIGHLEAAAGVAGLIKTVLCLKHRKVPGNLHFDTPNPKIPFEALRLHVPTSVTPWPEGQGPACAGVNSFGFGGTNAHVILQEAPQVDSRLVAQVGEGHSYLLPLSSRSHGALRALAGAYLDLLAERPTLADLCYSASMYRSHHGYRLAVVGATHEQMCNRIETFLASNTDPSICQAAGHRQEGRLVFVFTGMGAQWWGMGRELLHDEPIFRAALERVDALLRQHADWSILSELTAAEGHSRITQALFAQTGNFAIQVALVELWKSWGVEPHAIIGHSVGEVAAAWAAGALDLESAVYVSYHRARLQSTLSGWGRMLAVGLGVNEVLPLLQGLENQVEVAAVNSPSSVTLSGIPGALEAVAEILSARGAFHRKLQVDVAYHTFQMDEIRQPLLATLKGLGCGSAHVPLYSTVTGGLIADLPLDAAYWWRNVREPVRLQAAVEAVSADGYNLFLEVGPHPVLGASIQDCLKAQGRTGTVLRSLRRGQPERPGLFENLGRLYESGYSTAWNKLWSQGGGRVRLPSYPWQREPYWAESAESREDRLGSDRHPFLARTVAGPAPTWEADLNVQSFSYLTDHRIEGTPTFPGSAYVEAGLTIALQVHHEAIDLEEIEILKPLVIDGQRPVLRLTFTPRTGHFTVHSRTAAGDSPNWALHAHGQVVEHKNRPVPPALNLATLRGRLKEIDVGEAYQWFAEHGLAYGPAFRPTKRLWRGNREALAELVLVPELATGLARTYCQPTLLDAGIQALLQAMMGADTAVARVYLPVRFERVRYYARHNDKVWAYVSVKHRTPSAFEGDVILVDDQGALLLEATGVRLQALPRSATPSDPWAGWLYESRWEKLPAAEEAVDAIASRWLVVGGGDRGRRLASDLERRGAAAIAVKFPEEFGQLIGDAEGEGPAWGLVFLGGLNVESPANNAPLSAGASGLDACAGLLAAVDAFRKLGRQLRRLDVVTCGAREVNLREKIVPGQAALVGLARVIGNERPDLLCRCIDLDAAAEQESELCAELLAEDGESQLALRGSVRYALRQCRLTPAQLAQAKPIPIDAPALDLNGGRGNLDTLHFRASKRRPPGPGEVELRVRAVGLNFKDVLKAMGMLSSRITEGTASSDLLGLECSATVERVGECVTGLQPGDAVLSFASGCFATYLTVKREDLFKAWPGATHEELATILVTFATAYYSLYEVAGLEKGESVLIHAASGGVGLAAIQVARWRGAKIFATAGSPEKRDYLRSLGIDHVMDSRSLAFADEVRALTNGRGVDVVLNSLAGKAMLKSIEALAPYGRFVEIGKRDIDENNPIMLRPFNRCLQFTAVDIDRLRLEQPERMRHLTEELLALFRDGTFRPLRHVVYPATKVADAFRHLAQAKQIGKIVVSLGDEDLPRISPAWEARSDATYVVTGGLGGVGLETARWLAARGARHLVLVGRQAPSPEARVVLAELKASGVFVHVTSLDVSDAEEVARLFADLRKSAPTVRGVLHLAALLDDAPHQHLTRERLAKSLAPKAAGAWNLHLATRTLELDFFVLFSSVSVVVGNPGQGNYVAANAFLDALAVQRRREAVPGLSVNWGALAGAGMLVRSPEVARSLEVQGLRPVPIAEALDALSVLLSGSPACVCVADIDWGKWSSVCPRAARDPRFAELVAQAAPSLKASGSTPDNLSEEQRLQAMTAQLRSILARVIRQAPDQVPVDLGLDQLGVDSLLAVELQTLVHAELGASLATMDLMRGLTVTQLATSALRQIAAQVVSAPAAETAPGAEILAPAQMAAAVERPHRAQVDFGTLNGTVPSAAHSDANDRRNGKKRAGGPMRSRFETFPEYLSLRERIETHEATGAEVPFFRVQERVDGPVTFVAGRELLNYSGYNYLGLSGHPRVNRAAQEAVELFGTSVSASRMVSGERPLHRQLEASLMGWLGTEDAVVFVSGYLTNVTVIGHLLGPSDVVFHDALIHNSAMTGCKLSGARTIAFPHNDWEALDRLLYQQRGGFRRALIVLEGVYSMDGDFPDLPRFVELKKEHDTLLMVDEAHSLGVLGPTGRGIGEHFGVRREDVDLWMGTLSKALASCGGYIAGSRALVTYLRNTVPGLVYSVGLTPADTAAALAALEVLGEESERVITLRDRANLFLQLARECGLNTGTSGGTAVVPVIVGNSQKVVRLSEALFERGINVAPIFFPAVEDSAARLRFFLTCQHTEEQIRQTVEAVTQESARLSAALVESASGAIQT